MRLPILDNKVKVAGVSDRSGECRSSWQWHCLTAPIKPNAIAWNPAERHFRDGESSRNYPHRLSYIGKYIILEY